VTNSAPPENDYVVVLTALSDVRVNEGGSLSVSNFPTSLGRATFVFSTRYEDRGLEAKVPRELVVEVSGRTAATLMGTVEEYGNVALGFLPFVALAANCDISDARIDRAFDVTRGKRARPFFQAFTTEIEPGAVRLGKLIDREATAMLIGTIVRHPEQERLRRAAAQYRLALGHWLDGHEVMAIAHLWIAVEALTKVARLREQARMGLDAKQLADSWDIPISGLDGEVRRRVIFQGDRKSARQAREASDGLEHGYLGFGEIRDLARATRDATAKYVREAIFDLADLDEAMRKRLLVPPYGKPMKSWIAHYLKGKLVGETDELAAPGESYPGFTRTTKLIALSLRPDGNYTPQIEEKFSKAYSEGLAFEEASYEIWGARDESIERPTEPIRLKVDRTKWEVANGSPTSAVTKGAGKIPACLFRSSSAAQPSSFSASF